MITQLQTRLEENPKEKKERKQRAKKPADAPKNGKTAYMFYCQENREKLKKKEPELKGKEITTELSKEWNKIKDTAAARKYQRMANTDKERYNKEMEEYKNKAHDEKDEFEEEEEQPKDKTLTEIISEIINEYEGDAITKKIIKKKLADIEVEYTKEEFEAALAKAQE